MTEMNQDSVSRCDGCVSGRRYHCDNLFLFQAGLTAVVGKEGDDLVYDGQIVKGLDIKDKAEAFGSYLMAMRLSEIGCTLEPEAIGERFSSLIAEVAVQFDIAE